MKFLIMTIFLLTFVLNIIFPQNNHRTNLESFYEKPILDENITLPLSWSSYDNFDELFKHIGKPIKEIPTTDDSRFNTGGNYTRGFMYEYFSVSAVYLAFKDIIYVYLIWLDMTDEILYNHSIRKNDSPNRIMELFGNPLYIENLDNGNMEYSYKTNDRAQVNFQFADKKLISIIFIFMT